MPTLTPASHDFGQVAVNALGEKEFAISGLAAGDSVYLIITGPDVAHFEEMDVWCSVGPAGRPCRSVVTFRPRDIGRRTATLVARDARGNRATATLSGEGMFAACKFTVVPCNSAHLYSGSFTWTGTDLRVRVSVDHGEAECNGNDGRGIIVGKGLIGIEFLPDPVYSLVYRIVVACPTPHWPATENEPETPSQPAELGNSHSTETYKQPVPRTALGFARRGGGVYLASYPDLQGALDYPADGEGGGGHVTWQLQRCRAPEPGCPP